MFSVVVVARLGSENERRRRAAVAAVAAGVGRGCGVGVPAAAPVVLVAVGVARPLQATGKEVSAKERQKIMIFRGIERNLLQDFCIVLLSVHTVKWVSNGHKFLKVLKFRYIVC